MTAAGGAGRTVRMHDELKDQPAPVTMVPVTPLDTETVEAPESLPVQPVPVAPEVNVDVTVTPPPTGPVADDDGD